MDQQILFFECEAPGTTFTFFFAAHSAEAMDNEVKESQLGVATKLTKEDLIAKLDPSVGPMLVTVAIQDLEKGKPVALICSSEFGKTYKKEAT